MVRFLWKQISYLVIGISLFALLASCQPTAPTAESPSPTETSTAASTATQAQTTQTPPAGYVDRELETPAKLAPLPYPYEALEKVIDAETMKLHHDKHHAAYVNNLNDALKKHPELQNRSVESLLRDLNNVPEDIRNAVRNNGGGHLNHTIFWQLMSPQGGGEATGAIATEINQTFGSFDAFKKQFNEAGAKQFGSGWVWLVRNPQGQLQIVSTPNQDNPIADGSYPIMGNDVWEHAYYLKYRNRRAEYLEKWWNVVNWSEVNKRAQVTSQKQA
ncbi:superoxide dismutase [Scytonema sp. UIC 10036]|uniref:superoxide dismutase n=1 Tax=Scytonema sp. UIC 10036 TaxID=2304196 RepID=UPI0012DA451A|nr:superoxide dismutase [Scytonema sp. UIC 10036]MUG99495.1 superoxide dismutase [Scytonema sp. UIC 10036]